MERDLSFAQSPFNEVDNLILSCFSYVNLDEITAVQDENGLTLEALSEEFFKIHTEEELKADKSFIRHAPFMMRDMAQTRRFGRSVIRNYVNEIVAEEEQQFSAVEILLEDGSTYAAFRGTDDTIVGWKEDFNLSNGIIPAEERAAEYLERIGRASSRMLRVGTLQRGIWLFMRLRNAAKLSGAASWKFTAMMVLVLPRGFWRREVPGKFVPGWCGSYRNFL